MSHSVLCRCDECVLESFPGMKLDGRGAAMTIAEELDKYAADDDARRELNTKMLADMANDVLLAVKKIQGSSPDEAAHRLVMGHLLVDTPFRGVGGNGASPQVSGFGAGGGGGSCNWGNTSGGVGGTGGGASNDAPAPHFFRLNMDGGLSCECGCDIHISAAHIKSVCGIVAPSPCEHHFTIGTGDYLECRCGVRILNENLAAIGFGPRRALERDRMAIADHCGNLLKERNDALTRVGQLELELRKARAELAKTKGHR